MSNENFHVKIDLVLDLTSSPSNWLFESLEQQLEENECIENYFSEFQHQTKVIDGMVKYHVEFDLKCEFYPRWIDETIWQQLKGDEQIESIDIKSID